MPILSFIERRAGVSRVLTAPLPCRLGRLAALVVLAPLTVFISGCRPQAANSESVTPPASAPPILAQSQSAVEAAPSGGNASTAEAPGEWGSFNEVLRSGGIYKNSSGKYLKLTFAPLGDSMDAIFADAPSGKVTLTNANGDRNQGTYNLERDRTLTVTPKSGKKLVFEMSKDGRTLSQIGGGHTLKLQP